MSAFSFGTVLFMELKEKIADLRDKLDAVDSVQYHKDAFLAAVKRREKKNVVFQLLMLLYRSEGKQCSSDSFSLFQKTLSFFGLQCCGKRMRACDEKTEDFR